jgi:hypothetical protein
VVGVPGHTVLVEHQQVAGFQLADQTSHLGRQLGRRHVGQPPVRVIQELDRVNAQHLGGDPQLAGAYGRQLARRAVQCGRFAVGEAQHGDRDAAGGEPVQQRAEPERLIVRVRHHHEQASHVAGQRWELLRPAQHRVHSSAFHGDAAAHHSSELGRLAGDIERRTGLVLDRSDLCGVGVAVTRR